MLLALDVGNTNVVFGVYTQEGNLIGPWRLHTQRDRTTDEHAVLMKSLLEQVGLNLHGIQHVAISSVVPTMNDTLAELAHRYFRSEPFFVSSQVDTGIAIHYSPPSDVGADRICNAVGAYARYGGPAVVVDFGTATTFDAIASNGDYLGGAILPGIGISMDALFRQASRLFRVEFTAPPKAVGTNTVHAIQSGLVFGYAGQTDAMVQKIREEIGLNARVIATGGLAELIHSASNTIEIVDQLVTLEGLRLLFLRNHSAAL